ncbi:periplasmic chaperone for outer membrane proteins Skp [Muriicola jejuensis]|uniref:OmpH family outer membrane protein n=1 Tax=Muriicola jejuensis TaxID=504488 RepID=A0A6P0UIA7_9FLAO|nr:OmpH family outer membrane protein [Muriicola jejuensis]NER09926.1 OmpH family outer membrane protein [Muriicola jejuensis]SMP04721.1 periplasmic chaperone for outer membrane proteins Skp [Muriicola jejuensis]
MKKVLMIIAMVSLWGCQQDKIGFVNNVRLMDGYKEKIAVEARFAEKRKDFELRRDSISRVFQNEAQAVEIEMQKMSQTKAQETFSNLQQKGQRMGQMLQQQEQQLNIVGQAEMDSVVQKVRKEIEAYGKANGYTFILGGGEGGSVLYGDEAKDITDDLLKVLNAEEQPQGN